MDVRRFWLRLGLWPRMAAVLSLGFLALLGLQGGMAVGSLRQSTRQLLEARLALAQMAAGQVDTLLERAVLDLEQARRFADFDPADPDLADEAHMLAHTYGRVGTFAPGIAFLDAQGRLVLGYPADRFPPGTDFSQQPHIAQALAAQETTISDAFLAPGLDLPVVAVTVPIRDETGRFLGLLSGLVNLEGPEVTNALERAAAVGHTDHAVLFDRYGRILASTFGAEPLSPGEHATFYRRALSVGTPTIEEVPVEASPGGGTEVHIMAFAPLAQAPWGIAVGGTREVLLGPLRRIYLGLLGLALVVLAGVWGAALLGTRKLVRPVRELTAAAQRIAAGRLDTPLQVPEGGEIGELAEALETMRRTLLANLEELTRWGETLEARVAERTQELAQKETRIRELLRRTLRAQEEERARIARELHDATGQALTALQLTLDRLDRSLPEGEARAILSQARELLGQTLADLRRLIADLRPGVLDQLGLVQALGWLLNRTLRPAGIEGTLEVRGIEGRLPPTVELVLFRIAQEALHNLVRHSGARRAWVRLERQGREMVLQVEDDGRGFEPDRVAADPASGRGLGLAGMAERASLVGGRVRIESAPGEGTRILVRIPLLEEEDEGGSNRHRR